MNVEEIAILKSQQQKQIVKSIQVLMGICSGIVADNEINSNEIVYLKTWIEEHHRIISIWPADIIYKRILSIIEDNVITKEEHDDLLATLQELSGNYFNDTGVAQQPAPTSLNINESPVIVFNNLTFCLTGNFISGTRNHCVKMIEGLGGTFKNGITKDLDYLIIGALVSKDWINTSYGRKLEKAHEYKNALGKPTIITEQQWIDAINKLES